MRPIRLIMQALGPYAGREVIDFRDALAAGLFGIYGQTGSGKSTIFSAMTFALFGETAKPEQSAPTLRSDLAPADLMTEVEFVFEIADRQYVVRRRPEQPRPKKRGTGEIMEAHTAWLFDATGIALADINEDNAGKVIAERKVSLVAEAITALLGYGAEQFRRIVLLPQGRFEQFLVANTADRRQILRELFDVSLYRKLTEKLKKDAAEHEAAIRREQDRCKDSLTDAGFDSPEALSAGIEQAEQQVADLVERTKTAKLAHEAEQKLLADARSLAAKFDRADQADKSLSALMALSKTMEELALQVSKAERAKSLLDVERHFRAADSDLANALTDKDAAHLAEEAAKTVANQRAEDARRETQRADEIDALRENIAALDRHRETLNKSSARKDEAIDAAKRFAAAEKALSAATATLKRLEDEKRGKETILGQAREENETRREIEATITTLEHRHKTASLFEKAQAQIVAAKAVLQDAESAYASFSRVTREKLAIYEEAERDLAQAQAQYLASKLVPGQACPVCGGTDHPAPAQGKDGAGDLEKQFRETKRDWETARKTEQDAENKRASAEATLRVLGENLSNLDRPEQEVSKIESDLELCRQSLSVLGPQADLEAIASQITALDAQIGQTQKHLEDCRVAYEQAKTSEATAKALLEDALSTIPMGLRGQAALDTAREELQEKLEERSLTLKTAQDAAQEAREAYVKAQSAKAAADDQHSKATNRRNDALTEFNSRLTSFALTQDEFSALKPAIGTVEEDRARVEKHRRDLDVARSEVQRARGEIENMARPDIASLEARVTASETAYMEVHKAEIESGGTLTRLKELKYNLAERQERLQKREAETGALRDLSAKFDAQNELRLGLETFAIGAMFDQVLIAANQRFDAMTSGRFSLEREQITGGGRAQRGLGIEVFDIFTGKQRNTHTLSGGESFIAALALALGLADVVESTSGKVRLDTIFIDEGFGSLDTENGSGTLDQVLQALRSLASRNRAVGLISHVPQVQEAIPIGFYVRKDAAGSHVETRDGM